LLAARTDSIYQPHTFAPAKAARSLSNKGNYTMEYFYAPFEVKASNSDDGYISGYGSVFNNIDSYGDVVAPGAFKKTIADAESGTKSWPAMLLQHGGESAQDQTPIGTGLVWRKTAMAFVLKADSQIPSAAEKR
jgi:hypothetical protein